MKLPTIALALRSSPSVPRLQSPRAPEAVVAGAPEALEVAVLAAARAAPAMAVQHRVRPGRRQRTADDPIAGDEGNGHCRDRLGPVHSRQKSGSERDGLSVSKTPSPSSMTPSSRLPPSLKLRRPSEFVARRNLGGDGRRATAGVKRRRSVAIPARRANRFRFAESCQVPKTKIFRFTGILIYGIDGHPAPPEGRIMIVTTRWCGLRWTLRRQAGSSRRTKTPQRTAKSCGPGAAILALRWRGISPPATGARKAASPGRAPISRKAIARGKPGCPGCTCS